MRLSLLCSPPAPPPRHAQLQAAVLPLPPLEVVYGGQQQRTDGGKRNKRGSNKRDSGKQQQPHRPNNTRPPPAGPWLCINPWVVQQGGWPGAAGASGWGAAAPGGSAWRAPGQGLLGAHPQAHTVIAPLQVSPSTQWDQAGLITALQQLSVQGANPWIMDSGASSHMSSTDGILISRSPSLHSSITVGNGTTIPVTSRGHTVLPTASSNFTLKDVLVVPSIIRNLICIRQFTRDNHCSIEFDALGFSIKDLQTRCVILRCNSNGDLYTILSSAHSTAHAHLVVSSSLWHQRLGHPSSAVLDSLNHEKLISCNKVACLICHSCQLGKHARLPFSTSTSSTYAPFEIVHCDVWTSPVMSISGYSYYLVLLDDFTHFCWTFPIKRKSDEHQHLVDFISYARTQFALHVKCLPADNGTKFVNNATTTFLAAHGIRLPLSCPYTSPQNRKAERILRTLNNSVRTLLIHDNMRWICYSVLA